MDTRDLRCFRLVYEEGSINKAANQLFITPQGLSRIIRKLEDEFQTSLFKRTTSGTIPTKSGDYNPMSEKNHGFNRVDEANFSSF